MWGWVLGPWAEWIELSWTDSGLRVPESSLKAACLLIGGAVTPPSYYLVCSIPLLESAGWWVRPVQFSSIQSLSYVLLFVIHGLQHERLPCSLLELYPKHLAKKGSTK